MKKILSSVLSALMICSLTCGISASEGTLIEKESKWVISTTSENSDGYVGKAFDMDASTYWHTKFDFRDGKAIGQEGEMSVTVDFGEDREISGWLYTPRSDNATGTIQGYNIYKSDDGIDFEKIYTGTFDYGNNAADNKPMSASWGNQTMRYINIEITKSAGSHFGSAAEIQFYTGGSGSTNASGKKEDKKETSSSASGTTAAAGTTAAKKFDDSVLGTQLINDSWNVTTTTQSGGNTIGKAFDSDATTYWHSSFGWADGHAVGLDTEISFTVDFGRNTTVSGWLYTPRSDNAIGTILAYDVYMSSDGNKWEKIYTSAFPYTGVVANNAPQGGAWGDKVMRFIKIDVTDAVGGGFGSAAEVNFYKGGKAIEPAKGPVEGALVGREAMDGTPLYAKTGWTATVNSDGHGKVSNIFDNNVATYWHTSIKAAGGTVTGHDEPPFHLVITLPKDYTTSGIILTPRTDNPSGIITKADIYVSATEDGDDWFRIREEATFTVNYIPQEIAFSANITVRRVWIEVLAGQGGYGTLAEFDLMMKKDDFDTLPYDEYLEYEKKNSLYALDRTNVTAECEVDSWGANIASNTLDGSNSTFWQTAETLMPIELNYNLGNLYKIKEIRYLPRQTNDCHGAWLNVSVLGSTDGDNWKEIKSDVNFEKNVNQKAIIFDNEVEVKYVKIMINDAFASRASAAEVNFYQTYNAKMEDEERNKEEYILQIGSNVIETTKGGKTSEKELDVSPFIVNGSTMIPLRGLLEEMGAEIVWDDENQIIDIDNGQTPIKLQIWSKLVYVYGTLYGDLRYTLLNPPIIKDSRTFVPIRFVSEQLGYNVSWDGETQTVTIRK